MLDYAINNETTQGGVPVSLLTNNLIYRRYDAMAELILTKICSKCKAEKPLDEFYRKSNSTDDYISQCKDCIIIKQKQYYKNHTKERLLFQSKYWAVHIEEKATYQKQYYLAHREEGLIYRKKYYQDHKKESAQYRKDHKKEIAERDKQYRYTAAGRNAHNKKSHKRRALIASASIEDVNPIEIFERDDFRCQLCGIKTSLDYGRYHSKRSELDHVIPLSKGGEHSPQNTQCLCRHCNAIKSSNIIGKEETCVLNFGI